MARESDVFAYPAGAIREAKPLDPAELTEVRWRLTTAVDAIQGHAYCFWETPQVARLLASFDAAVEALFSITDESGRVCDEYETCEHRVCQSSHAAWEIATGALQTLLGKTECDAQIQRRWEEQTAQRNAREAKQRYVYLFHLDYRSSFSQPTTFWPYDEGCPQGEGWKRHSQHVTTRAADSEDAFRYALNVQDTVMKSLAANGYTIWRVEGPFLVEGP